MAIKRIPKRKGAYEVVFVKKLRRPGDALWIVRWMFIVVVDLPDGTKTGPLRSTEREAERDKECLVGKTVALQRGILQRLKEGMNQTEAGAFAADDVVHKTHCTGYDADTESLGARMPNRSPHV